MSQLINITTDSFQAVRFTQNARLVPEQSLDIERRKAIARHYAFTSRNQGGMHTPQISQINSAFSGSRVHAAVSVSSAESPASTAVPASQPQLAASAHARTSSDISKPVHVSVPQNNDSVSVASTVSESSVSNVSEPAASNVSESAYHVQRGSFEMRVANGSLSYVPQLAMTIVTQHPEVHVEYIGGFNYFPDSAAPENEKLNLFV